jgi:hypothetical protein
MRINTITIKKRKQCLSPNPKGFVARDCAITQGDELCFFNLIIQ